MDIKTLAAILLAERLVSTLFISLVIRKQVKLFKLPILNVAAESMSRAIWARRILFMLSATVLISNLVPVVIDSLTLTADLSGRSAPSGIGIAYAISNATTSVLFSLLVFATYKLAERITLEPRK